MMSVKPKEKAPYDHLQAALIAVSAARLAVIDGPNPPKQANGSESAAAIQSLWTVPGLRASRQKTAPGKPDIYFRFFYITY